MRCSFSPHRSLSSDWATRSSALSLSLEAERETSPSKRLPEPKIAETCSAECIVRNSNEASRPSQSTRRLYRERRAVGNAKHGLTVLASPTAVIASSARRACRPSLSAGSLTLPLVRSTSNGRADKKTYAYGTAVLRPFATSWRARPAQRAQLDVCASERADESYTRKGAVRIRSK